MTTAAIAALRAQYGIAPQAPSGEPPEAVIARLARSIAARAPEVAAEAREIAALAGALAAPSRDDVAEAIEGVVGDDAGTCFVSRITEAVMRVWRRS